MSSLKPQPLPYTKKGIFGAPGQGFSGIGVRVGQSVSGLWSNIASGVASSLLNRSLGLTGEVQISSSQAKPPPSAQHGSASPAAGTNIVSGKVITAPVQVDKEKEVHIVQKLASSESSNQQPPTLVDGEMETLYAGFQKRRKSLESEESPDSRETVERRELDERSRRLKKEEAKIRALNNNGRVDFSIQESMFDISLIASIASHLSYWADEDVSHFMLSQLLAQHSTKQRDSSASRAAR
jgi:hypothetical protein